MAERKLASVNKVNCLKKQFNVLERISFYSKYYS